LIDAPPRFTNSPAAQSGCTLIAVTINGDQRQFEPPLTCAGLIAQLGFTGKRVALELNGEIVPRGMHASQPVKDGDKIEIVAAVGGG
jgi:sulfur carrier protein